MQQTIHVASDRPIQKPQFEPKQIVTGAVSGSPAGSLELAEQPQSLVQLSHVAQVQLLLEHRIVAETELVVTQ